MTPAPRYDSDQTYCVQVSPGKTIIYGGIVVGDRGTLQVPGDAVAAVVAQGGYVVDPDKVPDAATIGEPEPGAATIAEPEPDAGTIPE